MTSKKPIRIQRKRPWWMDSDAIYELKMQMSSGLFKQGFGFIDSKEGREILRMMKEIRKQEEAIHQ